MEIYAKNYDDEWPEFIGEAKYYDGRLTFEETYSGRIVGASIRTPEGVIPVAPGDWVINGVQGEIYCCKPDIFEATYEPVE